MAGTLSAGDRTYRSSHRPRSSTRLVRVAFFCMASAWGYLLGIGVLAAAAAGGGSRLTLWGPAAPWLAGGLLLGLAGGVVAAGAYREVRRRSR
jgi:hypothetical protein